MFDETKVNGIKYGPEWQERRLSEVVNLLKQVKKLEGTPMVPKLCEDAISRSTELCNNLVHAVVNLMQTLTVLTFIQTNVMSNCVVFFRRSGGCCTNTPDG